MHPELELQIDHVTLSVDDISKARQFYGPSLNALGLERVADIPRKAGELARLGYGIGRKGSLWIIEEGVQRPATHICFRASSRDLVDAFWHAAMGAGGEDNGRPGVREVYHPAYYAAFVLDPWGHNIEAVTFAPAADG